MKKVSTSAAATTRNFCDDKLTIGLDLGDRNSCYCVLDENGQVIREQKLSTTAKAQKQLLTI
jgi:Ethanolamine utilization protein EutJ (predicted chaperonin)